MSTPRPWCDDDRQLDAAVAFARELKVALAPPPADLTPIVTAYRDHRALLSVAVNIAETDASGPIGDVVSTIAAGLQVDSFVLLHEVFMRPVESVESVVTRGELRREFDTDPASAVLEAVAVLRIAFDEATELVTPFGIADGGGVDWHETIAFDAAAHSVTEKAHDGWRLRHTTDVVELLASHGIDPEALTAAFLTHGGHAVRYHEAGV